MMAASSDNFRACVNTISRVGVLARMPQVFALASICALAWLAAACGPATENESVHDAHDSPVAASEPRAELAVVVDLASENNCEERFDLALYKDDAVELVTWEPVNASCEKRKAKIRYLSKRTSADALAATIRHISRHVEILAP
jgi:hypothetical protein